MKSKVNLFWFEGNLTRMEMLTIKSIYKNNMIPVIWAYNVNQFKEFSEAEVYNANEIIDKKNSFIYQGRGNTRKSFGCGFTDIFRAKLMYEVGGWYSDFDITFLDSLDTIKKEYAFRKHCITEYVPNLFKAPAKSDFCKNLYNNMLQEVTQENNDFFKPLKIFSNNIINFNLQEYEMDRNIFGNDDVNKTVPFFVRDISTSFKTIHWCNELFKNIGYNVSQLKTDPLTLSKLNSNKLIKDNKIFFNWNNPVKGSLYDKLLIKYEL